MVIEVPVRRADDPADARHSGGQFIHARMAGAPENDFMSALSQALAEVFEKYLPPAAGAGAAAGEKDSHRSEEKDYGTTGQPGKPQPRLNKLNELNELNELNRGGK